MEEQNNKNLEKQEPRINAIIKAKNVSHLTILFGATTAFFAIVSIVFLCLWIVKDTNYHSKGGIVTVDGDGYIVVNGFKTEFEVKNKNHIFSEWELYNEGENDCEKKLFYRVCSDCSTIEWKAGKYEDHDFVTVTTPATCQAGGYDTKTCNVCEKIEICNNKQAIEHKYDSAFIFDEYYHWQKCSMCHNINQKEEHRLGENETNCSICKSPVKATAGVIYEISTDGTYAEVIGYNGMSKNVKIAEEYNGVPVTGIYKEAFRNNKQITSVIIPEGVTNIGNRAFWSCTKLSKITLPNSLTNIGELAFYECWELSNIEIPSSVRNIGYQAFYECSSLSSIVIPDSVNCGIDKYTFEDCTSLKSVVIGNNVKYIGENAFNGCSALESITIGNSVDSIGYMSFLGCDALKNIVIPDNVTWISQYAFYRCGALEEVTIGNGVITISSQAFDSCENLKKLILGDSVNIIGSKAFYGCSNLESIIMSNSVSSIGDEAFAGCTSLSYVYYTGTESQWSYITMGERNYSLISATKQYNYIKSTNKD